MPKNVKPRRLHKRRSGASDKRHRSKNTAMKPPRDSCAPGETLPSRGLSDSSAPFVHQPVESAAMPDGSIRTSAKPITPSSAAHEDGVTPIDPAWLQEQAGEWAETFAASNKPIVSFDDIYAWGGTGDAGREGWQSEPLDIPRDLAVEMVRRLEARAIEHPSDGTAARPAPSGQSSKARRSAEDLLSDEEIYRLCAAHKQAEDALNSRSDEGFERIHALYPKAPDNVAKYFIILKDPRCSGRPKWLAPIQEEVLLENVERWSDWGPNSPPCQHAAADRLAGVGRRMHRGL